MTVSIVTGAGSGIGRAVALTLAERGETVSALISTRRRRRERARPPAPRRVRSPSTSPIRACVRRRSTVSSPRTAASTSWSTCAGIELGGPAEDLADDTWLRCSTSTSTGRSGAQRSAGRAMIDAGHGGRIVLIGSINRGSPSAARRRTAPRRVGWRCSERVGGGLGPSRHHRQHRRPGCRRHPDVGV